MSPSQDFMPSAAINGNGYIPASIEDEDKTVPIAIVGMSLRFPDTATSADSLWSLLMEGRNTSREFPPGRLDASTFYHPDPNRGDSIPVRSAHFIDGPIDRFDASFFSLSAAEVLAIDPQCRSLLETTYRALENAGISLASISNSNTSVYTGSLSDDFKAVSSKDMEQGSKYTLVGMGSLLAGRLSWFFNLLGPSITIDTACSSSLVAFDLGCQSLVSGTSNMSIVTGSNLIYAADMFHMLSNMGMLSPDGKSYSFDHRANGYGRGEGVAALILKRLPDALRDGDTIRGIVRSTGTNADGHTPGVTQPSKTSQTLLIHQTYAKAGLSMKPTRYFEAHGTGTPIGDPIEASAIGGAFRKIRSRNDPMYTGSIKSNIGHLEGASGLAGIIKGLLVLEQAIIPPNANFEKLSPKIDDVGLNIRIPSKPLPWPTKGLRRVSVNSFGASGTNAHVVLDDVYHHLLLHGLRGNHCTRAEPPSLQELETKIDKHINGEVKESGDGELHGHINGHVDSHTNGYANEHTNGHTNGLTNGQTNQSTSTLSKNLINSRLLLLSGSDENAVKRVIKTYTEWLKTVSTTNTSSFLDNLAYTLSLRRTLLPYQSFAVINSLEELQDLQSHTSAPIHKIDRPRAAFIFTGQGAQWAGMGRELLHFPDFRKSLMEADICLKKLGCSWDVINTLSNIDEEAARAINRPSLSQTLCTILQVAIVDLYRSLNIWPAAVVGHSSGEIAAAYCTGALSKESAFKVAYFRGKVSEILAEQNIGGMMAVGLSETKVQAIIDEVAPSLTAACINSPETVTISGDRKQLQILAAALTDGKYGPNIFHRQLQVQVGYHSPQVSSVTDEYLTNLGTLKPDVKTWAGEDVNPGNPPAVMISSVTGEYIEPTVLTKSIYWIQNMQQPVRFSDAITKLVSKPANGRKKLDGSHRKTVHVQVLVEIGPHSALQGPIREILRSHPSAAATTYYSTLKRHSIATRTIMTLIGQLSCSGFDVNLSRVNELEKEHGSKKALKVVLPTLPEYPFDDTRKFWSKGRLGHEYRFRRHAKLDLLGKPVIDWNPLEARWTNFLKLSELPWAADHKINDTVIYPAVGMVIMAAEAAKQLASANSDRKIKGYRFSKAYFTTALVIPQTAAGIETHLHLRPIQDDSNRDAPSWDYKLYSCESGQWHENSRGRVSVEYEKAPNGVSGGGDEEEWWARNRKAHHDAEASSKSVLGRADFYKALWNSGYTFGPTFNGMDNVTFSDGDGWQSTADVRIFDWQTVDNSNHVQEHILHPATADGIVQTSLAVMAQGGAAIFPTATPTEVENIWFSNSGLTLPHTTLLKSRARLLSRGNIGYEASVTAFDSTTGKVAFDVKRFRLKYVTSSGSGEQQSREMHMCYQLQWKPDIDMSSAMGALTRIGNSSDQGSPNSSNILGQIQEYLKIATFKKIDMKILHFSAASDDNQKFLLDQFFAPKESASQALGYEDYILTDLSGAQPEELQSSLDWEQYDGLKITSWDLNSSLDTQIFTPNTFDLVLLSHASWQGTGTEKVVDNANVLLKSGGRILLLETEVPVQGENTRNDISVLNTTSVASRSLQDRGFSDIEIFLDERTSTRVVTSRKPLPQTTGSPMQFMIVIDENSSYQKELSKILQSSLNFNCVVSSLENVSVPEGNSKIAYIFLFELEKHFLEEITPPAFQSIREILISAKGILWLTARDRNSALQPNRGIIDGLSRVVRAENNHSVFVTASLENGSTIEQASHITTIISKTDFSSTDQNYESAYVQKGENLYISRIIPIKDVSRDVFQRSLSSQSKVQPFGAGPPLRLVASTPGLLDSLQWVEDTSYYEPLASDEVEVKVHTAGLNFRDLLISLGRINGTTLGTECAGVVSRAGADTDFKVGDRVAMVTPTALATYTRNKGIAVARVPEEVSLLQASTVPSQLGAAWDALACLAQLKKSETVLIHSGAGGTGQCAIQIAQYLGGEIFTTVGSEEKKIFLIENYNIPADHIFYSRDLSFADGIRRMTNERGVDVILNSLAGESLLASWDLIAPYGRFIEIGKKDIDANSDLPMRPFMRGATFVSLDVSRKIYDMPREVMGHTKKLLEMVKDGILQPAHPVHVLSVSDIQKGMRMLQDGKLIGKVVFDLDQPHALVPTMLTTKPSFFFNEDKTYLIAGGTGGLGLAIARWMVEERGCKNLLLLSLSGLKSEEAIKTVKELRQTGARIEAPPCDITKIDILRDTLGKFAYDMPPIGGCIQGSMILRDTIFSNMTHDDWRTSTDPKTIGSWNLHTLLPPGLEFFILLSSVAGVLGSAGQANYAAGNTYLDSLARYRVSRGQKAIAFNLGVMLENGFLASKNALRERILANGVLSGIAPKQFFALLDKYCDPSLDVLPIDESQLMIGLASPAQILKRAPKYSPFPTLPFYQYIMYRAHESAQAQGGESDGSAKMRQAFLAAEMLPEAGAIVAEAFRQRLLSSMPGSGESVVSEDTEALNKQIRSYGVDSLVAIELRGWFAKEFGADVPIFDILGEGTLLSIGISAAAKSSMRVVADVPTE
ncbi:hypothetical protein EAE96_008299 [Botrytis aclada]|nr:hypothetical protein EAE96_008299 [Botrytis aclada]